MTFEELIARGENPRPRDVKEYLAAVRCDPCAYCGNRCWLSSWREWYVRGLVLDHIEPKHRKGPDKWSNLTAACHGCNSRKRTRSLLGFLGGRHLYGIAQTFQFWGQV